MDDLPKHLGGTIYVISRGSASRWVVLECPCRCGTRIQVNLMASQQPCWRIIEEADTVTLRPSLWRASGTCMSHFFVERNYVRWV